MKNICLTLILLFAAHVCFSQLSPLEQNFTIHYKLADSLKDIKDYQGAISQLDLSKDTMGNDSLELAYNWLMRIKIYESMEEMDSVNYYFGLLEPLAKSIDDKSPLKSYLLFKGYQLISERKISEGQELVNQALEILTIEDFKGAYYLAHAYRSLSESYLLKNQMDSAYEMVQKMQYFAEADSSGQFMPKTYRTRSWLYFRLGNFEKSIEAIRIPFGEQNVNLDSLDLTRSVAAGNIALNYIMMGDYERAEEYLLAVTQAHIRSSNSKSYGYYNNMLSLANCYLDMQEYEKTLDAFEKFASAYQDLNSNYHTPYYYMAFMAKGRALAGLNRWNEAQDIFDSIVAFQKKLQDSQVPLISTYLRIGMANVLGERYETALDYLLESLKLQRAVDQLKGPDAIPIMGNIAEAYFGKKSYDQALAYMDSSLLMNQYHVAYDPKKVMRYRAVRWQIELLTSKLEFLHEIWNDEPSDEIMKSALDLIVQLNTTIDQARKTIRGDNSRLVIADDFYDHAVFFYIEKHKQTNDLNDLRMAFSFSENNKSFLLNEITGEAAVSDDETYQSLLTEKVRLKSMVSIHSMKEASTLLYQYFDQLDSVQQKIDQIAQYNHFRQIDDKDLKMLESNPVLAIHTAKENLYAFLIDNGALSYEEMSLDSTFQKNIIEMREKLSNPSAELTQQSMGVFLTNIVRTVSSKNLTIIPDGVLNYIPLELAALNNSGDSLLMDRFNINYRYSIFQLMDQQTRSTASTDYDLVGFAPDFGYDKSLASNDIVRNELTSLPGAFEEVETISELFDGKTFIKELATETNFKDAAEKFGMIHLATHALVDDKEPKQSRMIFNVASDTLNDGYLYVHEISSLGLNAQMVTLSACNTGYGKIKRGEGVMSLSRAFAYAGVPATVVSLWPASDKSTPELMKYFYQNLKDGQRKSVALSNAKKQYLASAKGKARHPFYWAGFVVIGDDSPIEKSDPIGAILIIVFLVAILPIVIVVKKKYLSI